MKKSEILEALNAVKKNIGPKNNKILHKDVLVKELKNQFSPKADGKGKCMDEIRKKINTSLAKPKDEITFESVWKPTKTSAKDIYRKILIEAELENRKPNAFRMNLLPVVIDKTHAKMSATRGDKKATIEVMYPNANGKITLKIQVDGAEDKLVEIGLEDEEYINGLGPYIIELVDESIEEAKEETQNAADEYMYGGGEYASAPAANLGKGSFSPNWEAMRESDSKKMEELMPLVEQLKDEPKDAPPDLGDAPDAAEDTTPEDIGADKGDLGDVEDVGADEAGKEDFGEEDFAVDAGADTEMGDFDSDFGGDFGLGGGGAEGGDVNAEEEGEFGAGVEDVEYMTFRDKDDWLVSSMDAMQKLVSKSVADKMQEGSGVIMTSDEILNGTPGIKGDTNYDIIDKFLKIYPELDEIDLTEEQLEQIDEKLSLDDGQFDAWLQQKLPEFTQEGREEVEGALDNEMFDDFKEMGGEKPPKAPADKEFEEFLDITTEPEPEEIPEYKEAEHEVAEEPEMTEFPEVGEEEVEKVEEEGKEEKEKPVK